MSYTRAISTLGCPDLSLDAAVALARRHRLGAIELRALGGSLDLADHLVACGSPQRVAAELQGAGVTVCGFGTSLKAIGGTGAQRDELLRLVPWAEALGVPWLRVFDGGRDGSPAEMTELADTLHWWRELRARFGWKTDVMIETHDSLLTGAAVERLLAVAPGTAIRWDTHHTWKKGGEDPLATWGAIKQAVVSVDIKDSVSRPSAKHHWTYVLPGEGEFPMAPLRAVLQREYTGVVSLEWEKLWHPYLPSLEDALDVAAKRGWW